MVLALTSFIFMTFVYLAALFKFISTKRHLQRGDRGPAACWLCPTVVLWDGSRWELGLLMLGALPSPHSSSPGLTKPCCNAVVVLRGEQEGGWIRKNVILVIFFSTEPCHTSWHHGLSAFQAARPAPCEQSPPLLMWLWVQGCSLLVLGGLWGWELCRAL